ncbi:MAG: hypothetical protein H6779_02840 [Candidatus Nomurabacteria bacterium]|nr:hypothetical protein [Candidatus Nomurabacteria bacterium]USN87326.1 MAG: hypothetical protein H6779_02840 [Candidatus Nomurabacteria bacterium]
MNYKTLFILAIILLPSITLAQYQQLVGIGVDPNTDFGTYINRLYALSIAVAALLAVIKIIIAGLRWMLSDIVTSKQEAKSDIWGATLGLLIVISAVLVLTTINPQLANTQIFLAPPNELNGPTQAERLGAEPAYNAGAGETLSVVSSKAACEDIGGTAQPTSEAGSWWCIRKSSDVSLTTKVFGCVPGDGNVPFTDPKSGVTYMVPNYDCSAQEAACADLKGTAFHPTNTWGDITDNTKIACTYDPYNQ